MAVVATNEANRLWEKALLRSNAEEGESLPMNVNDLLRAGQETRQGTGHIGWLRKLKRK